MRTIAVTGTNGKTSVCSYLHQFAMRRGLATASTTSVGFVSTVPLPDDFGAAESFSEEVESLAAAGIDLVIVELVSRAISRGLVGDHRFDGVAVLDVTGDHLEEHGGFARYLAIKQGLLELATPGAPAVVTTNFPSSRQIVDRAVALDLQVRTCGPEEPWALVSGLDGGPVRIRVDGVEHEVGCALPPGFSRRNLVPALALADAVLGAREELLADVPHLLPPSGRMEEAGVMNGATILVDNSHNAGALEAALRDCRRIATNRVVVVFGCGGDRDRAKRPLMGSIAAGLADLVFVTDDNPRSEDPAGIRAEILQACPRATEIADRREAIWSAMEVLQPGDVLLVAGRGGELTIETDGGVVTLDDRAVVAAGVAAAVPS